MGTFKLFVHKNNPLQIWASSSNHKDTADMDVVIDLKPEADASLAQPVFAKPLDQDEWIEATMNSHPFQWAYGADYCVDALLWNITGKDMNNFWNNR